MNMKSNICINVIIKGRIKDKINITKISLLHRYIFI